MLSKISRPALAVAFALTAGMANANPGLSMLTYVKSNVMSLFENPLIIEAVKKRNAKTAGLSDDQIQSLDQAWRAQVGAAAQPLISSVMNQPASSILSSQVAQSEGIITEIFVMDARGLNVAASDVTSDYWQGDEAKFQKTYGVGPEAVDMGEIELDESTSRYQGQISFTLTDPATGEAIGAVTVGLDATSFVN